MNLLGKIFVVLIFAMSLMFMAFAVAVWAVNRNYYEAINDPSRGYKAQKAQLQAQLDNAQSERDRLQGELARERSARRLALAAVEAERLELRRQVDELVRERDQKEEDTRRSVALVQSIQDNLTAWRREIDGLRQQLHTAVDTRNSAFDDVVRLTDEVHQLTAVQERLQGTNDMLLAERDRMRTVIKNAGLREFPTGPEKVDGIIRAVRDNRYVAINIGEDDGLQVGDVLEVYRDAQYLGRVRVLSLKPDYAVCEIVKSLQRGPIRVGDNVTTQIKVG